jgi:hypothetical protein
MFETVSVESPEELYLPPGWMPTAADLVPDVVNVDDAVFGDGHGGFPPAVCSPADTLPSGWLALELDQTTADPAVLGDAELVDAVVGFERLTAWAAARQARLLAEFARRRPGDDPAAVGADKPSVLSRYAPDEIGLALRLSRGTAMCRLGQARQLDDRLPRTLQAWQDGRLDERKVRAICDAVLYLGPEQAAAVQDRVLDRAPQQTLSQLRSALARAVIAVDGEGANRRYRAARTDRRVSVGEEKEGMASLWALLPAPAAGACYEWLSRLAHSLGVEDPRGMDARRADLLVDLITGRLSITPTADSDPDATPDARPSGPPAGAPRPATARPAPAAPGKPLIHIVMPYSTLTGADDQPCELIGYGPIPAEPAREIAADAVWKRLLTDPVSGALLDHGRSTYRPPQALADYVRARDQECRNPICRRRALSCELDHALAWDHGGHTVHTNLWAGCPHDHHLKHHPGWTVTLNPDGSMTWTTPTGHRYTSEPWNYPTAPPVRQEPGPPRPTADDDEPPPF